jgi:hypothetical protein
LFESPTAVIVVDDRIVIRGRLTDHSDLNAACTIVTRQTAITMRRSERGPWTRLFRCSGPLTSTNGVLASTVADEVLKINNDVGVLANTTRGVLMIILPTHSTVQYSSRSTAVVVVANDSTLATRVLYSSS